MSMLRRSVSLTLLVGLFVATGVRPALAGCTQTSEAKAVNRSLKLAVQCNNRVLRAGPGITCRQSAAPACADTLVGDAAALAYGANNPASAAVDRKTMREQLSCQRRIGKAVSSLRRDVSAPDRAGAVRHLGRPASATTARPPPGSLPGARRAGRERRGRCPRSARSAPPRSATPAAPSTPTALRDCLLTLLAGLGRPRRAEPAAAAAEHPLHPHRRSALGHDRRHALAVGGADVMPRTRAELGDSRRRVHATAS